MMSGLRSFVLAATMCGVVVITAACGSSSSTPTTPTPSCAFSITQPASTTFGPEGGTGTVAVAAASGCTWTATSSAAFVAISSGASGTSNGTVAFAVAINSVATDRTATLTIAGSTITITQRAAGASPTGTLAVPTLRSPIGGAAVDPGTPTLVVNNAAATGSVGTVTYRFEVSDTATFPADPVRTFTQDGVAQGSGTTSWVVNHTLGANVLWYWHARATNGTQTTAYSATETFSTGTACSFALSSTGATLPQAGGTGSVNVTTTSACAWTAASNDAFITLTAGSSGTGNGTVSFSVAPNSGATTRTGTLTIAGQTFTITENASAGLVASFQLVDSASQAGSTTECRFRSATGAATTCMLQSTSFTLGGNTIASYSWTVQYTYDTVKTITGTGATQSFTDTCGGVQATADGAANPLSVTLTVTDNLGATATATAGSGSQPGLLVRLFTCGS